MIREVKRVVQGYKTLEGAGVQVVRVLGIQDIHDIDPFLLLDAFDSDNPEDYVKGFPMHPHRGIETITYLLEGEIVHRDSLGNGDKLVAGELQWMTAGSGIIHEEMPQASPKMKGLQFWLNLPAADKMTEPKYFAIMPEDLKEIPLQGGHIKLISGDFNGESGVKQPHVKANMMDLELYGDVTYEFDVSKELNSFVYILEGEGYFGSQETLCKMHSAVIFGDGDSVKIRAGKDGIRMVVLSALPLNEEVAWGGPIVMNSQKDLQFAFYELNTGTFLKHEAKVDR